MYLSFEDAFELLGTRGFFRLGRLRVVDRLFDFGFFFHRGAEVVLDGACRFLELFDGLADAASELRKFLRSEKQDEDD